MELIRKAAIPVFSTSGIESRQLLFPENCPGSRVTITEVTLPQGSVNPTHRHESSEQIWVAIAGEGTLLLGVDATESFSAGDVVRFADGDLHGFHNSGTLPFVYLSVTSPPINFRNAYSKDWDEAIQRDRQTLDQQKL